MRLRERNLCNHRDYQNLARNGANSNDTLTYVDSVSRNPVCCFRLEISGTFSLCKVHRKIVQNAFLKKENKFNQIFILQLSEPQRCAQTLIFSSVIKKK